MDRADAFDFRVCRAAEMMLVKSHVLYEIIDETTVASTGHKRNVGSANVLEHKLVG